MPSVYGLKPRFQALLRPITDRLARAGVTANQVTLAAAVLSIAVALVLIAAPDRATLLLVPLLLFVRMALNAIDGMLAREHGQASRLGAVLNELGDMVSDGALYLALAVALTPFGAAPEVTVLFAFAALLTEAAGLQGLQIGAERRYDGPMGKSDRAAAVGLVCFLLAIGVPGGAWLTALFAALALLAAWTIVNRSCHALRQGNAPT
jgi:CDP-diacylglycerol--glycerol-3-phosphate 3-phosphatidyltransferase